MSIRVLYFASLREAVGSASEEIALADGVTTVGGLRAYIAARGGAWQYLIEAKNLRAAVNQTMVGFDAPVHAGDEVAFFPPVTGG
jgi:molybdopterin synthase sulfur carrier subunit